MMKREFVGSFCQWSVNLLKGSLAKTTASSVSEKYRVGALSASPEVARVRMMFSPSVKAKLSMDGEVISSSVNADLKFSIIEIILAARVSRLAFLSIPSWFRK